MDAKENVIKLAQSEVGYLEKKSNKNLYVKVGDNVGSANFTKYWGDLAPKMQGNPWCDAFVSWCFFKAFGKEKANKMLCGGLNSFYTPTSAQYYKNMKRWYLKPQRGDQIFFKNSQRICHTGIVYKVDSTHVYTIEGNTSGASGVIANGGGVCKKSYVLTYSRIAGYGRPDYSIVDTSQKAAEPKETAKVNKPSATVEKTYSGIFPALPARGYYKIGDGIRTLTTYKTQIRRIQSFLNWAIGAKLSVDGEYGAKTAAAVKTFQSQKKVGITADGEFGEKTLAKAKTFKK